MSGSAATAAFFRSIPTSDPVARRYYQAAADRIELLERFLEQERKFHDFTTQKWRYTEARLAEFATAFQPGIDPSPAVGKRFRCHLIWWPDELPIPAFVGQPGTRTVVGAPEPRALPLPGLRVLCRKAGPTCDYPDCPCNPDRPRAADSDIKPWPDDGTPPHDRPEHPRMKLLAAAEEAADALRECAVQERETAEFIAALQAKIQELRKAYDEAEARVTAASEEREELRTAYQDLQTRSDERIAALLRQKHEAYAETDRLRDASDSAIQASAREMARLKAWLRYIAGNFRDHRECAEEALRGDLVPEGFEG